MMNVSRPAKLVYVVAIAVTWLIGVRAFADANSFVYGIARIDIWAENLFLLIAVYVIARSIDFLTRE